VGWNGPSLDKMNLIRKTDLQIPEEIAELLGEPPIWRGESPDRYRALLLSIAQSVGAVDVFHWLWANEIASHAWQILRLQKIEAQLVVGHQTKIVEELLASTFDPPTSGLRPLYEIFQAPNEARKWASDPEFAKKVDERLAVRGHDSASILAKAYARCAGEVQAIQKRISDLELRRMSTLREISYRDEMRAKQLERKSLEIIEGNFSEAAE
jgi:hypothetical protein